MLDTLTVGVAALLLFLLVPSLSNSPTVFCVFESAFTLFFISLTFARGDKCCIIHQRVTLP